MAKNFLSRLARRRIREKNTKANSDSWGLYPALSKAFASAIVGLLVGYLSALVISPEQLYRMVFLPDANDFSGKWDGRLGGQIAVLELEAGSEDKRYTGKLTVGGRTINVSGSADSRASFSGTWDHETTLELSLFRLVPDARTVDEAFIQLEGYKDEPAAHLCPKPKPGQNTSNFSECEEVPGLTHFFR